MWEADRWVNVGQPPPTVTFFLPRKSVLVLTQSFVKQMTLETGEIGRQANGAVNLTYGDTVGTLCAFSSQSLHSK